MEQTELYLLCGDGSPDSWSSEQIAGCTRAMQLPLTAMHCPTRRPPTAYPTSWFGPTVQFYGTDPASVLARSDYAVNYGDDLTGWFQGGADLTTAATLTTTNTWANVKDVNGICFLRSQIGIQDITDGTSNTYMLGEKYLNPDSYYNGADEADNESMYAGCDNDNQRTTYITSPPAQEQPGYADQYLFGSAHTTSLNMSFCDGSVQAISYSIDPEVHRRLGNRRDGLPVDAKSY
jgi:prepilin-type processing-associated H-X9-DG protein